jgi:hypothetical protein
VAKKKSSRKANRRERSKSPDLSDPPPLDRRAIEGLMRQFVPTSADGGSEVDAAQQVMFDAFE